MRRLPSMTLIASLGLTLSLAGSSGSARAQTAGAGTPAGAATAAAPKGVPELALDVDREIDIANIVTSAAKGVTTVQEAPAIITIITSEDITARGFKFVK